MNAVIVLLIALLGMPSFSSARCGCLHGIKPFMLKAVVTPRKSYPELETITVDGPQEKEPCKDCLHEDDEAGAEPVIEKKYAQEPQAGVIHRTVTRIKNYVAELPQIPQPSEKQLFNGAVGLASVGVAALALNVRRKTDANSSVEEQIQQLEQDLDEANRKLGEAQARQAGGDEQPLREVHSFHAVADSGQDLTQIQSSLADVQRSVEALSGLVQERQPQVDEQSAEQQTQILEKLGNLSRGIVFLVERIREVRAAQEQAPPAAVSGGASVDHSSHHVATQKKVDELWQEMYQVEDRIKTEVATILQAVQVQEGHFGIPEVALGRAMNQFLDGMPNLLSHANSQQNVILNGEFLKVMKALEILLGQNTPQSSLGLTAADREFIAGLHQSPVQREAVAAAADVDGLREVKEGVVALEERRKEDSAKVDAVGETADWIKRFLEENRDNILANESGQILLILQELQQREQRQTPVGLTEEAVRRILQEFKDELKREIPAPAAPKQEPPKPKPVPKPVEPPEDIPAPESKQAPKQAQVAPKPKPRLVTPPAAAPLPSPLPKKRAPFASLFAGSPSITSAESKVSAFLGKLDGALEKYAFTEKELVEIFNAIQDLIRDLGKCGVSGRRVKEVLGQSQTSFNAWKKDYVKAIKVGQSWDITKQREANKKDVLVRAIKGFKVSS